MDKDKKEKLKQFLNDGSELAGALVAGGVGVSFGLPGAAIGGAIGLVFTKGLADIIERSFSGRQRKRVAASAVYILHGYNERIKKGDYPRNDDFFTTDQYLSRDAAELFEGTLLKCSTTYQERKIQYISKIFEETAFNKNISAHSAHHLLVVADSLTFSKMCIISLYGRLSEEIPFDDMMQAPIVWFPDVQLSINNRLVHQDIFELVQADVLKNEAAMFENSHIAPSKVALTPLGKEIFRIMDFSKIEMEHIKPIMDALRYREEWGKSNNEVFNSILSSR